MNDIFIFLYCFQWEPFLWAWHPTSTAVLVQCLPIAGNNFKYTVNFNLIIVQQGCDNLVNTWLLGYCEAVTGLSQPCWTIIRWTIDCTYANYIPFTLACQNHSERSKTILKDSVLFRFGLCLNGMVRKAILDYSRTVLVASITSIKCIPFQNGSSCMNYMYYNFDLQLCCYVINTPYSMLFLSFFKSINREN